MIQTFVTAWDKNKVSLRNYLGGHPMGDYKEYKDLVSLLFQLVINPYLAALGEDIYDVTKIHEIDDSEYTGTLMYLIPVKTFGPSPWQYVLTHQYYGSCSGCDDLQGIHHYEYEDYPSNDEIDEYMQLFLGLLQHCKIPYELGEE